MSCDRDPATRKFATQAAHWLHVAQPELAHRETDIHDIASWPRERIILLGREFRKSSPRLKRQKLMHELVHFAGVEHDAAARRLGYYSQPERDGFSRQKLRELERG